MKKIYKFIISYIFLCLSIVFGLRLFDLFLKINDRPLAENEFSIREYLKQDKKLKIVHDENYNIDTQGKDTILLIGDSFGVGTKCGNEKNIAGCLKKISNKHIVNLSDPGKGPGNYLNQLKDYINIQRNNFPDLSGETVYFMLYSNDIVLDDDMCSYYEKNRLRNSFFTVEDNIYLSKSCNLQANINVNENSNLEINMLKKNNILEEKDPIEKNKDNYKSLKMNNKKLEVDKLSTRYLSNLKDLSEIIFGTYATALLREAIMQFQVQINFDADIGRASFINKWGNNNPERKLITEIIDSANKFCIIKNCNIIFTIFPNVENLRTSSLIYKRYNYFAEYLQNNKSIIIYNGYIPFIEKGIKSSTYSLTDMHSSCKGYELYAKWLLNLRKN